MNEFIDVNFNFYSDAKGRDPDKYSPTLRRYHKILWSKKLPSGDLFVLDDTGSIHGRYLYYTDGINEHFLTSDAIGHSYSRWKRTQKMIHQFPPEEIQYFFDSLRNISSYIIFPGNVVNKLPTINGERGMNSYINDRFDLTLECIRLFYRNEENPLFTTFNRYKSFFDLFVDFKGYCDFFLLQDFVENDYNSIRFYLPFDGFVLHPYPKTVETYKIYKMNVLEIHEKRKNRIKNYVENQIHL